MKNNLYAQYGDQPQTTPQSQSSHQGKMPDPWGSMGNMQNAFQQFRNGYRGNAQQEVQQLLQSGRMSPQQFRAFQMIAQRIAPFLGGR